MAAGYGRAIIIANLREGEMGPLGASAASIYDGPVEIRSLYEEAGGGEEHYVVRYPAGTRCRLHRHTAAHTMVVLEGHLRANGQVIGPGSYARFPGGEAMQHQPAGGGPCVMVVLFHGPFDVEIVDEG